MTEPSGFPRRAFTLPTLVRGDAMRAGEEWVHDQVGVYGWASEKRDHPLAAQRALGVIELPRKSLDPSDGERQWNLCVELFALVASMTLEDADEALRKDFKRYLALMRTVMNAWQSNDSGGKCQMPFDEIVDFSYFWCNECGNSEPAVFEFLRSIHTPNCTAANRG